MKKRLAILFTVFFVVFSLYAVTRYAMNIPTDRRGYDAMDYVSLHGNIQFENASGSSARPTDVTGVYLVEGSANATMIGLLQHLPNLHHITIGPDFRLMPIGTKAEDMPRMTDAAKAELAKMQAAFPDLQVRLAEPTFPTDG